MAIALKVDVPWDQSNTRHRWRLELEYFQVDRSRTRATTEDIDWGDQTFPAGTLVETEFNVAVTRLSCGYSFFKRPDKELGVALGFHVTDIKASLSGSGGNAETGKVLAPLPVLSMYGQVALTDIWALAGRLDWFKLAANYKARFQLEISDDQQVSLITDLALEEMET